MYANCVNGNYTTTVAEFSKLVPSEIPQGCQQDSKLVKEAARM